MQKNTSVNVCDCHVMGMTSICHFQKQSRTKQITRSCFVVTLLCKTSEFNTLASGWKRGFSKKIPKRTWLCAGISLVLLVLRTWSKCQKTRQVF